MKKTSLIVLLLVLLISCEKDKNAKNTNTCDHIASVEPALVGKWKLLRWSTARSNTVTCESGGGMWYNTSDWAINVVLEIRPEGTLRTYKNDTLVNESFPTNRSVNTNGIIRETYNVNCGKTFMFFKSTSPLINSLHDIQIGDTLEIYNPFVDLVFYSVPTPVILSLTGQQHYVKVE
ncbi:hypothetical protein H9Y05_08905 [Crocinitomicaceae bacterium CZZ-1]|uniref:Lipocalin-like domain-containing protein n=1 Tax=Taishania pollutisoli TaxID=2766479 RepID=A0A8J6P657_9FLAO|nr:hypothetical protein [Taishania pollutisoli]MBC9812587.1 hypothetical protein [Taishania pollutisoli]